MAATLSSGEIGAAASGRSCGVYRASAVQGKGLHRCAGSFPGDDDSPSDEDGDGNDGLNGSNDYG
ncbi:hypothetical protein N7467_003894 [Penicillium canescens]|nr:hypothetical protein N7467_003894 [Penicillium canescens]